MARAALATAAPAPPGSARPALSHLTPALDQQENPRPPQLRSCSSSPPVAILSDRRVVFLNLSRSSRLAAGVQTARFSLPSQRRERYLSPGPMRYSLGRGSFGPVGWTGSPEITSV